MFDSPNPHTSRVALPMHAFNIIPGVTFMMQHCPDVFVAVHVSRNGNTERVHTWLRNTSNPPGAADPAFEAHNFDYCDVIHVVGVVVNPDDPDETNWGDPT